MPLQLTPAFPEPFRRLSPFLVGDLRQGRLALRKRLFRGGRQQTFPEGFGFIQPTDGTNDVFVHISAVERAGLAGLAEGQKVNFEAKTDKMRGKVSAESLSLA